MQTAFSRKLESQYAFRIRRDRGGVLLNEELDRTWKCKIVSFANLHRVHALIRDGVGSHLFPYPFLDLALFKLRFIPHVTISDRPFTLTRHGAPRGIPAT